MAAQPISVFVNNKPGVLALVSDVFGRNGFNIEALRIASGHSRSVSLMKIYTKVEGERLRGVVEQLEQLVDVLRVIPVCKSSAGQTISPVKNHILNDRNLSYWVVAYCLFITLFGTNVPSPLYAIYQSQWQLSTGMITLIYAIYGWVIIPTLLASRALQDRIGNKMVLLAGIFFTFIGSTLFAVADNSTGLLAARVCQGLSVGILNGVALSIMTELHRNRDRRKAAYASALAITIGNAVGPLAGGWLGEYGPYPLTLPFLVHALLVTPGMVGLLLLRGERTTLLGPLPIRDQVAQLKRVRGDFTLSSFTSFAAWSLMSLFFSLVPAYLSSFIGHPNLMISGVVIAIVMVLSAISQFMLKRWNYRYLAMLGCGLLIVGLAGLVATIIAQSLTLLVISASLIGIGHGPAYAGSLVLANRISTESSRSTIISVFYVVTYLGVSLPIVGLGFAAARIGMTNAIIWFAGLLALLIVMLILWWLHHRCMDEDERKRERENSM